MEFENHLMVARDGVRIAYYDEGNPEGPVMVVSNHTGQIPVDAGMIFMSLLLDKPQPLLLRAMVDHFVGGIPFVGNL